MQRFDSIVRGGSAVLAGTGLTECDIAITEGKIAAILASGSNADAHSTVDVSGLVVLPGAVDVHLHLGHGKDISRPREPGDADVETAAAVKGGVTCIIPYLMASEPFEAIFDEVVAVTQSTARIDFGYHFIISTEDQLESVPAYAASYGAPSFKIFMNNRGGEGNRLGLPDIDDGFLFRLCEAASQVGGMVCPHPENIEVSWVLRDRLKASDPEGRGGLAAWDASRPSFVEAAAVQTAAYLAGRAGAPLYVVHTSSAEALDAARRQRAAGATVFVETCPQYLTHDTEWEGGDVAKVNPPLRSAADRESLWQGIMDGSVDTIATDHVHRDISAKEGGIWSASPGCPGMETMLPVMLTEGYHKRGISLERIVELIATNPARTMGLGHVKGAIAPGLDADLAIVDLAKEWKLSREDVVTSAGYSIYEGMTFKGRVEHTFVRGVCAMENGRLREEARGLGRYVKRVLPHAKKGAGR